MALDSEPSPTEDCLVPIDHLAHYGRWLPLSNLNLCRIKSGYGGVVHACIAGVPETLEFRMN